MSPRLLSFVLLGAAFVGCQSAPDPAPPANPAGVDGTAEGPADEAPGSASYEAILGGAEEVLVLASDGSEVSVLFGMGRAEAVGTLTPYLGAPASEGVNEECPMGPMLTVEWANGLSLLFPADEADPALAGWRAAGDDERLQVQGPTGVQLGTPRDLLLASGMAGMETDSTLGDEFYVGTTGAGGTMVGGFLSGPEADATVSELFSGVTCYAR